MQKHSNNKAMLTTPSTTWSN